MVCYPPSGYVTFSLRMLKFYEGREPGAGYEDMHVCMYICMYVCMYV